MSTLNRKLLRELYRAKGMLLAVTSIIAVGIMCYVSMQSAYNNLAAAKERYYRQCRMADFWIDVKKVPLAEIDAVARLPGITDVQPRIQFFATADLEDEPQPINSSVISLPAQRNGIDGGRHAVTNDIILQQGSYFTDTRDNEVIVNAKFAAAHRIEPGDWIHLLLNNRRQELFVVGTAISSEYAWLIGPGALIPDPKKFGVFYVKDTYAEEVFDFEGAANQLVGHVSPALKERPDEVLRRAENLLDDYGVFAATPLDQQASNTFLSGDLDGTRSMAIMIPTIFLTVAALVLNVLITRLARQQRTVVGTLKALGYSDGQIFRHFLMYGLVIGIFGGLIGCGLGVLAASGLTQVFDAYYSFPDLRNEFHWNTNVIGLLVSIACAEVGSIYGAWSMLKLQPAEAMRPEPPKRSGRIFLESIPLLWNRLSSPWRAVLRGIARNRLRTLASLFAASMGTALLVSGFMMTEAQNYFLDFEFYRTAKNDIEVTFADKQSDAALAEIRQLPGVAQAEPVLGVGCTFINGPYRRKGGITALSPGATMTVPHDTSGRPIRIPDSGLVLTSYLAKILHVETGDTLTVTSVDGKQRGLAMTVASMSDRLLRMTAYADLHYVNRVLGEEMTISGVQLRTNRDQREDRRLYAELKQMPAVQSMTQRNEMVQTLEKTLLQNQSVFITFLTLFSGVIFFGSIVNSSLVNLAERQREVATLAALGYTRWQIGAMFLREASVVNVLGVAIGMPMGYGLVELTAYAYATDLARLPVVSAPWVWLTVVGLSVVFLLLAHVVVQWRIHRLDVLEGLKVKE